MTLQYDSDRIWNEALKKAIEIVEAVQETKVAAELIRQQMKRRRAAHPR